MASMARIAHAPLRKDQVQRRLIMDEALVKARDAAWAKLEKQKVCPHEHVMQNTETGRPFR
jgi:hypothetical protein